MSNILNPGNAPMGGHAGYGKGAEAFGTEADEERTNHSDPIAKQADGMDDSTSGSQTSQWKEKP